MGDEYIYYVAYLYEDGSGYGEAKLDKQIDTIEDIEDIAKYIEDKEGITGVTIINFKFLKKTNIYYI